MPAATVTKKPPPASHEPTTNVDSAASVNYSPELGQMLQRLERQERVAIDRRRQQEIAKLRELARFD